MTAIDAKALEDASRAYCDVIRLNYEALSAPLAAKRDEAMRAAITAYLQALSPGSTGETEGWRDIESAPKDWSDVILHDPEYDNDHRKVFEGYYDTEAGRWRDAQNAPVNPTHWRPLPEPPSAMLSAAGER